MMSSNRSSATVPKAPYVFASLSLSKDPFMSCLRANRLRITGMFSLAMNSTNAMLMKCRVEGIVLTAAAFVAIRSRNDCVLTVPNATV